MTTSSHATFLSVCRLLWSPPVISTNPLTWPIQRSHPPGLAVGCLGVRQAGQFHLFPAVVASFKRLSPSH